MNFEEFKEKYQKIPIEFFPNAITELPFVSVCVQTYQHVAYIKDCLEGILMQQTNFPFEILLGEDQSNDGTRELCIEYAKKHSDKIRLFLHHRENNIKIKGRPTGRFNFLFNLFCSRGKYIAMCEGDDYWTDPLKLQKQVDNMEMNSNVNICSHQSVKIDDKMKRQIRVDGDFGNAKRVLPMSDVILYFAATCPMQAILIRNKGVSSFVNLALDAPEVHGLLQVFWAHPSGVLYLPEPMSVYRANTSTSVILNYTNKKGNYFIWINGVIKKLLDLNEYFKGLYAREIYQKIKNLQYVLVTSTKVSLKHKISLIANNRENFPIHLAIFLLTKSMLKYVIQDLPKSLFK
jgi:glycosyltransferase involved in cell wall biosynthesis